MMDVEKRLSYSLDDLIKEEKKARQESKFKVDRLAFPRFANRRRRGNDKSRSALSQENSIKNRLDASLSTLIENENRSSDQKEKFQTPQFRRHMKSSNSTPSSVKMFRKLLNSRTKESLSKIKSRTRKIQKPRIFHTFNPFAFPQMNFGKQKVTTYGVPMKNLYALPYMATQPPLEYFNPRFKRPARLPPKSFMTTRRRSVEKSTSPDADIHQIRIVTELNRVPQPLAAQINFSGKPLVQLSREASTLLKPERSIMTLSERFS